MAAKQLQFDEAARQALLRGVSKLARAVKEPLSFIRYPNLVASSMRSSVFNTMFSSGRCSIPNAPWNSVSQPKSVPSYSQNWSNLAIKLAELWPPAAHWLSCTWLNCTLIKVSCVW